MEKSFRDILHNKNSMDALSHTKKNLLMETLILPLSALGVCDPLLCPVEMNELDGGQHGPPCFFNAAGLSGMSFSQRSWFS